jgi:hypothetical protein
MHKVLPFMFVQSPEVGKELGYRGGVLGYSVFYYNCEMTLSTVSLIPPEKWVLKRVVIIQGSHYPLVNSISFLIVS